MLVTLAPPIYEGHRVSVSKVRKDNVCVCPVERSCRASPTCALKVVLVPRYRSVLRRVYTRLDAS